MIEQPKEVSYIDIDLMRTMCHPVAVALFDSSVEPMARFDQHERERLEGALGNPQQTFGGAELYPTLAKKAAILYYGLIKNHAFENGNKRTATASLLVFLFINHYWIPMRQEHVDYLVSLATRVAASEGSKEKNAFLEEIENWIEKFAVEVDADK